ncbi:FadR/GntR family transcriptional regulator [Paraburkholderia phenoliruptrix]|uniref:FadR/GntR family transcriptional regulator n=2 Tax=Paraburkholderia phenoliruptrix TaxID=252970 RepID=A0A6J5K655_9BURK|nr:FCD domain-containing protein [Paraburkholderia phenoliruptrix]AFT87048.1 GntR family transcriptional regulator [Paraburkholderia phenoliruptrix BR3459a]MDR6389839.1 DNA-binding FadR family transcriptional regulator [Paraburkholderia phenoliruptrix]CAB4049360.1 Pyruvate dehydrogenase complex repressor [Paraburkholderia phenoliruptrix]
MPHIERHGRRENAIQHDLHGRVAHLLATAILRGDYAPESILPREAELMDTFGVSRTVLREALRTLTSKGLIESRPRVGTRVRPRHAWNLLDADVLDWYSRVAAPMQFALKLQEMREMIEPYAAGLAAASHSDETFGALSAAHAAMAAARNVDEWVRADLQFHLSVLIACSNELLIPLGTLIERTLEAQLRLNAKRADVFNASLAEHTAVFEAIRARDAAAARDAMARLLGVTRGRIEA